MNQTEPKKKRYVYLFLISLVVLLVCSNILAFQFAYILPNWLAPNILVPGLLLLASFFYIIWYVSPVYLWCTISLCLDGEDIGKV